MPRHLNPLEKEAIIKRYKAEENPNTYQFCQHNGISVTSLIKWTKIYDEFGIEGLANKNSNIKIFSSQPFNENTEALKREILRLLIENERLKKNYIVARNQNGQYVFKVLRKKNLK